MPYVTSVERIGLARGLARGREEGREEGARETLRRFVEARFGAVPPALEQRIAAANRATLDQLVARVAVVPTIDDL